MMTKDSPPLDSPESDAQLLIDFKFGTNRIAAADHPTRVNKEEPPSPILPPSHNNADLDSLIQNNIALLNRNMEEDLNSASRDSTEDQLRQAMSSIDKLKAELEEKEVALVRATAENDAIRKCRAEDNEEVRQLIIRVDSECKRNKNDMVQKTSEFNEITASLGASLESITVTANQLAANNTRLQEQINAIHVSSAATGNTSNDIPRQDIAEVLTVEKFKELSQGFLTEATFTNTVKDLVSAEKFRSLKQEIKTNTAAVAATFESILSPLNRHRYQESEELKEISENLQSINDILQQIVAKDSVSSATLKEALQGLLTSSQFSDNIKKLTDNIPSKNYLNTILSTVLSTEDFQEGMESLHNAIEPLLDESTFNDTCSKLLKTDSFHKKTTAMLKTLNENHKKLLTSEAFDKFAEDSLTPEDLEELLKKNVGDILTTEEFVDIAKDFLTHRAFKDHMKDQFKSKKNPSARSISGSQGKSAVQPRASPRLQKPGSPLAPQPLRLSQASQMDDSPRLRAFNLTIQPARTASPAQGLLATFAAPTATPAVSSGPSLMSNIFKSRQKRPVESEDGDDKDDEDYVPKRRKY